MTRGRLSGLADGGLVESVTACRQCAAVLANAEDTYISRLYAGLVEERRIRGCLLTAIGLVSVGHCHIAGDENFDQAFRVARWRSQRNDENMKVESPI